MGPLKDTLMDVKNALVGKDMRSGLVQQVNDLDNKVDNLINQSNAQKEERKKREQENFRLKLAAVSFGFTLLGFILELVFNHFAH
jgi:hypothetical protein